MHFVMAVYNFTLGLYWLRPSHVLYALMFGHSSSRWRREDGGNAVGERRQRHYKGGGISSLQPFDTVPAPKV